MEKPWVFQLASVWVHQMDYQKVLRWAVLWQRVSLMVHQIQCSPALSLDSQARHRMERWCWSYSSSSCHTKLDCNQRWNLDCTWKWGSRRKQRLYQKGRSCTRNTRNGQQRRNHCVLTLGHAHLRVGAAPVTATSSRPRPLPAPTPAAAKTAIKRVLRKRPIMALLLLTWIH